jgi:hypothetical protein
MSEVWRKLDEEVAATPMPEFYQKKKVIKQQTENQTF